ncbi:MAG: tetratricopeptide (TPR) repeat protein [Crocinitomix sp.]|jgi:tetratricopeptide (TPR) repeat protein
MAELSDKVHSEIKKLCSAGDNLADKGNFSGALSKYWKAFDLIPDPKTDWDAATWILVAIGDSNFLGQDYEAGRDNLANAMHCPGAIGNPFIHMRLGQCQFELNNLDKAADELTRAYAIKGDEIFSDEDPKYLDFLKTRISTEKPKKKKWWQK